MTRKQLSILFAVKDSIECGESYRARGLSILLVRTVSAEINRLEGIFLRAGWPLKESAENARRIINI